MLLTEKRVRFFPFNPQINSVYTGSIYKIYSLGVGGFWLHMAQPSCPKRPLMGSFLDKKPKYSKLIYWMTHIFHLWKYGVVFCQENSSALFQTQLCTIGLPGGVRRGVKPRKWTQHSPKSPSSPSQGLGQVFQAWSVHKTIAKHPKPKGTSPR